MTGATGTAPAGRGVLSGVQRHVSGGGTATPRIRVAGLVLLTAHLLIAGWLTLRPLAVPWVAPGNLRPFATIRSDLAAGPHAALESIGCGLLMFAPLGVLLPLAAGRLHRGLAGTCARTVFAGAMISLGTALLQTGIPGQVVNVDTVLLNTAGVALSCLLLFPPLRAWLLRRTAGEARPKGPLTRRGGTGHGAQGAQGSTPRAPRVGIAP
ncbi:VanZ family protein [Streptomyces daliensis]